MRRIIYAIIGVSAILIGGGIIIWVFYNVFIERQEAFTGIGNLGLLFFPFVMVGYGIYWIRKGIFNKSIQNKES